MDEALALLARYGGLMGVVAVGLLIACVCLLARLRRLEALKSQIENERETVLQALASQTALLEARAREDAEDARQQGETLVGRMDAANMLMEQRLHNLSMQLGDRLERVRDTLDAGMTRLRAENSQKLDEMRKTVDEKLHDTLNKRLGESFSRVSEQLENVYKGLGDMQKLATGVGDLKKVLTNVKTRGIWGEVQLGALLAQALDPSQFEQNAAVKQGSQERVEFAVKLPGREDGKAVLLPIDSKFPAEDYARLLAASEAGDAELVAQCQKALTAALKTQAKTISQKYIAPPGTTDFAIMFLPTEGLYAEALRAPGMVEDLQTSYRVVAAGPTTLLALLNSLQMGFRTLAIEKRSGEVWELLGAVKTEFARFSGILEKTQQRLRQASESIDDAAKKTRHIERRLRDVQAIGAQSAVDLLDGEAPDEL